MEQKTFYINRRNFLKGSFAGLVLSSFGLYGFDLMHPTRTYKVGLIGTGWYGKSDLFRLLQVTRAEVVSLCDVDENQLQAAAHLIQQPPFLQKKPRCYKDYKKMLSEEERIYKSVNLKIK